MSLLKLLSFAQTEVPEETYKLVGLIAIIALAVLAVIMLVLCLANKKMDTKSIVYAAVCLAGSFVLSFLKIAPVTFGGSITLASFVPILIYAYVYGPVKGLLIGLIYGVLQFIQDPYMLTPVTFLLDYLLAFVGIFLIGLARILFKRENTAVFVGTAAAYVWRFVMHFVSGLIYFRMGAIWVDIPAENAVTYSLLYQTVYLLPDMVITMAVMGILVGTKNFSRLVKLMQPSFYAKKIEQAEETTETQNS